MNASEPCGFFRRSVPSRRAGSQSGSPRLVSASSLLAGFCLLAATSPALLHAQERLEDFAEIYVDRYIEPDARLKLDGAGQRRSEALAHYARGLTLESQGRPDEAVEAFLAVLRISPGEVELARRVAYLLAESGRGDEGRKVLEESYRANPNSPLAGIALSEFLATFLANDEASLTEAMRLAREAVEKHPSRAAVYEHLVRMNLVAGKPEEARAVLARAMEREETNPFFWIQIGRVAQRIWPLNPEQSPTLINGIFEKALTNGKDQPAVRERVADYFHDSKQPQRALQIFQDLVKEFPDRLEFREKLARVFGALGRDDDVIATLKDVVEINPQDAQTHRELGRLYLGREDYQNAIVHFREAMKLTTGTAEEYDAIGRMIIFGADMPGEAVAFLERGAYLHPEDARLPFLLTFALAQEERYDEAVPWFEKVIELASQSQPELLDGVFYYRFGAAVERSGNVQRATDLFRTCMELLAKNDASDERVNALRAEVYNYLGYMWLENNMNIDEAGELIKEALAIVPDSGAITDSLGWFYFMKGQYEDARRELTKAESMVEQPDGVIYDHLGQTYFKLSDKEKAVEYLKKAVELEPENEEFRKRLAEYEAADLPTPKTAPTPEKEDSPASAKKPE